MFKSDHNISDIAHLPLDDPPIRERYWDDADRNTSSRSPKQAWSRMEKSILNIKFLRKGVQKVNLGGCGFGKKAVAGGVRKGKLGRDVFCGKSKTLCLTNTGDRFITAPYKACQPQPPKLERQGLNPTQIPIHSSDLAFSPKIIFLQPRRKFPQRKAQMLNIL